VECLQNEVCVSVAAAQDHTVFLTETYECVSVCLLLMMFVMYRVDQKLRHFDKFIISLYADVLM